MITKPPPALMADPIARINLRHLFAEADVTNREVIDATGISGNTITAYKNGNVLRPDMTTIIKLRDYFSQRLGRQVTLDEMVEIDDY